MRFNCPTSFVVSCQVPDRSVSAWIFSTMRLMLFFDGRYPRYAWPAHPLTPGEGRDLSSRQTQYVVRDRGLGNLSTPLSVQKLQMALHAKAKAEAGVFGLVPRRLSSVF